MATEIDLTKYSPGNIHGPLFAGHPIDALKHVLLSRAGVEIGHPLREQINQDQTHPSYPHRADNGRLPVPFDPQATPENPLYTVADWFRYLDDPANIWTHDQYLEWVNSFSPVKFGQKAPDQAMQQMGASIIPWPAVMPGQPLILDSPPDAADQSETPPPGE